MCRRPKVLLLDEPTSALDASDSEATEHPIDTFRSGGGSVIWVSHDAEQRQRMATRTLTIVQGALQETSP